MVILVYGEDAFRVKQKERVLTDNFKEKFDSSGMNVASFEYKDNDGDIMSAVGAPPFLADRRMTVVRGLLGSITRKADAAVWAGRVLNRGDETIVVLVDDVPVEKMKKNKLYTELNKKDGVHEYSFGALQGREAIQWVESAVKELKVAWEPSAVSGLVSRVGTDTWQLSNEVQKISMAVPKGDSVSKEIVESQVSPSFEDRLFAFLDAVRGNQSKSAVKLMRSELMRGTSAHQLLRMLAREVRLLADLRAYAAVHGSNQSREAARDLGVHPFVVKKTMPRAVSMQPEELSMMVDAVLESERRLKSTSATDVDVLEQMVIDLVS